MKPATAAFTFGILTTSLLAQGAQPPTLTPPDDFPTFDQPELFVAVEPGLVRFTVASEYTPFVGIVLISASPNLAHYVTALPPLLDQSMILTYGYSEQPRFSSAVEHSVFPPGVMWHVQGVAWSEAGGILASGVESFVLDVTVPTLPPTDVDAVAPTADAPRIAPLDPKVSGNDTVSTVSVQPKNQVSAAPAAPVADAPVRDPKAVVNDIAPTVPIQPKNQVGAAPSRDVQVARIDR